MRKVTFGGATSLDNFIARKDGSVDWLLWSKEVNAIMKAYWKTVDTVLMGRKTCEVSARLGAGAFAGVKNYVFSRTLKRSPHPQVELISQDAAAFVASLKQEEGKGICVLGGGVLAQSLFEADLIDEVGLNVHPVLLGSGVPLFHECSGQIDLKLIECKELSKGCVLLRYEVLH
ncbi:MAG TPA: dihydrofolate reductase family protein [Pyrinomonadaceae bacterium]|nr:dihydrofolate reductase family protein [Pyrinomonadaceae bacterium]